VTDKPVHPLVAKRIAALKDVEDAVFQLEHDMKYPVDAHGSAFDLNPIHARYPDVLPALVHHLVKAGWRRIEDKRFIKARPVKAAGFYEDLVTWVPMDEPDEPIEIAEPAPVSDQWSVVPTVTEVYEERE